MVFKGNVSVEVSARIYLLHTEFKIPISQICKKYPELSRATVYRHAKKSVSVFERKTKKKGGRPPKLNNRQVRNIIRKTKYLQKNETNFSSKRVKIMADVPNVSDRTVRRVMNKHDYGYRQSRKKGLMSDLDRKNRVQFCRNILKEKSDHFWENDIAFYLDGTSFVHKTNPQDQAMAPKAKIWRKKNEGLKFTSKGKKAGYGGKVAHFMVAISYRKGVILCEEYEKMNGQYMESFVERNFENLFELTVGDKERLFLQDGDRSQNCSKARKIWTETCNAKMFSIPPRSPDLNPIENVFHLLEKDLERSALEENLDSETFAEFVGRVKRGMMALDVDILDRTIESMHKRVKDVIAAKGDRLKY